MSDSKIYFGLKIVNKIMVILSLKLFIYPAPKYIKLSLVKNIQNVKGLIYSVQQNYYRRFVSNIITAFYRVRQ